MVTNLGVKRHIARVRVPVWNNSPDTRHICSLTDHMLALLLAHVSVSTENSEYGHHIPLRIA